MSTQLLSRLTLREFYRVTFRFRIRAIAFFVGTIAVVCVGLAFCPSSYTSVAKLVVHVERENVGVDNTVTTGHSVGIDESQKTEINTVKEMLTSRTIFERIVDASGDDASKASPAAREEAIRSLAKSVSIDSPQETNVVVLTYEARSPEIAQRTLKKLITIYLEDHQRIHRTTGSHALFKQRTTSLKQQLDGAIESLRAAKNQFGLISVAGRRASLQDQINQVQLENLDIESALSASLAKLDALKDARSELPNPLVEQFAHEKTDQSSANLRQRLYALKASELDILSNYTPEHPKAIAIRKQVIEAKRILESEQLNRGQAASAVMLTEQSNVRSLQASAVSLTVQMKRLETQLAALNQQEIEIDQLQRSVNVLEETYLANVKNLEMARIDQELHRKGITNIDVIQEASYVANPTSPCSGLTLAAALVIATLGAFGVAFLSDELDHTLTTPEMVESKLNLLVLASIPRFTNKQLTRAGRS